MTHRRTRCTALGAVLMLALSLSLGLAQEGAAQALVTPDLDPFYDAPADLPSHPPGTILRSRPVTITGLGVGLPVDAWQLLYRSNDSHGDPIATVATLMVPRTPYPGERPLLSYQMAIDSLGPQCRPSYTLRTGTQKELISIIPALELGWSVVTSDFEGPEDAYTPGPLAGHRVLDAIRASLRFEPGGLDSEATPVGLWGYSGGGQATAWAAELQPAYAPELDLRAVAQGGVPPDLEQVARQIDGTIYAGVAIAGAVGLDREFPEFRLHDILNERGKAIVEKIGTECAGDLVFGYPNERMSEITTVDDPLALPHVQAVLAANHLGKATPTAPVYMYHSIADQLIPIEGPDALAAQYCAAGATLFYERGAGGEHIAYAFTGAPAAIAYLSAGFSGAPPLTNCPASAGGTPSPSPADPADPPPAPRPAGATPEAPPSSGAGPAAELAATGGIGWGLALGVVLIGLAIGARATGGSRGGASRKMNR